MISDFEIVAMIENMGGALSFSFSPYQDVNAIPSLGDGSAGPIEMKAGKSFSQGYASAGSLLLNEKPEPSPAGKLYKVSIPGFYPKPSKAMLKLFSEMTGQRFIVCITDSNGDTSIVGNTAEPLAFTSARSTKQVPAERAGFDFEFSGTLTQPCPFLAV